FVFVKKRNLHRVDPTLLHFDAHHPWLVGVMETIASDYQPKTYSNHGPMACTVTGARLCDNSGGYEKGLEVDSYIDGPDGFLERFEDQTYRNCTIEGRTLSFLTQKYIPHCCQGCLSPDSGKDFDKFLASEAYGFHTCNSYSRHNPDNFADKKRSLLHAMAEVNCPFIWKEAQAHSNFW
ncbi:unnamed protein product, partial [Meganyctiphanes norvegica]